MADRENDLGPARSAWHGEGRGGGAAPSKAMVGLFADDPDLIDEVCESAMMSRERQGHAGR
jgi:hypothetical protein